MKIITSVIVFRALPRTSRLTVVTLYYTNYYNFHTASGPI